MDLLKQMNLKCGPRIDYEKKNYFLEMTIEANEDRIDDLFMRQKDYRPVLRSNNDSLKKKKKQKTP